jgi:hypothetical protein
LFLKDRYTDNVYEKPNAAHYFEIKPDVLEQISNAPKEHILIDIDEMINMSKVILTKLEGIYYVANMCLSSSFKIKDVPIENLFVFLWEMCNFDEKKALIEEISLYDTNSVCPYGVLINLYLYCGALKSTEFLQLNDQLSIQNKAIQHLRKIYSSDDDFWTDDKLVDSKLSDIMNSLRV